MNPPTKRGSSRRKGDEFQDLTALKIVLEFYIAGKEFRTFLEYEKNEAIDDIVTFSDDAMHAVQAKYAVDPLAVYVPEDFTDTSSRICFSRLAEGWRAAKKDHPGTVINIELLSNRGRDSKLENIVEADGCFAGGFIEGKVRYEDDAYSRELLSTGIRLRVQNSLMHRLLADTQLAPVVRTEEKRTHQDSHWKRKHNADVKRESICVLIV